jgi:DNA repair exonuclease SbcCD ATPase subunit
MEEGVTQYRRESDRRLDRIEQKLDKMAEALETLARTEEKILSMNQRVVVIEKKMEAGYAEHIKLLEAAKDAHVTSMMLDRAMLRIDALEELTAKMNTAFLETNYKTNDLVGNKKTIVAWISGIVSSVLVWYFTSRGDL